MTRGAKLWLGVGLFLLIFLGGKKAMTVLGDRMNGPRWDRLLPAMKEKTLQLLEAAKAAGLDVMFYDGWISPEQSAAATKAGTSKLKDPYNALHVWGAAVDIVFRNALGQPYWPPDNDPRWRQLAQVGQSVGLFSGGLNWGWDFPHFQLPDFDLQAARSRYGTDYLAFLAANGGQAVTTA